MNYKKALLFSAFLVPLIAGTMIAVHLGIMFYVPHTDNDNTFSVKPGEGFSRVNYRLSKDNLISNARLFHYYAKFTDQMNKLKAGTYTIPKGSNMRAVMDILTKGTPILSKVTIPEGKNMYEVAEILAKKGMVKANEFIALAKDQNLVKELGIKAPSLEGYLFPDTYKFADGTSTKTIIKTMLRVFDDKVKGIDFSHPFLSKHEVIILASIVEKETGAKWERPTIAGVYLNRLKKPMRLQADPTTIYGIWETFNGNLRKKHLLQKTPYNTYKINGLPLGPIANPSLAAIKAVLDPKEHNYLFFVSKNDGTHIFTPTYKKHLEAVNYWQKQSRNRKGKSWRDLKQ